MERRNKSLSSEELFKKMLDGTCTDGDILSEESRARIEQKRKARELRLKNMLDDKGNTYDLGDIFNEIWNDKIESIKKNISCEENTSYEPAFEKPDNNSELRKQLNNMFKALFGCRYEEALVRKGKSYIVGEAGKAFLKFLLKIHSTRDGRNIRNHKYSDIDFQYENYLLCHAIMFLDEREELDGEKKKTYEDLRKAIMERFSVDEGTMELKKSLLLFNKTMEGLSKDDDLGFLHEFMAIVIDNSAKIILNDLIFLVS